MLSIETPSDATCSDKSDHELASRDWNLLESEFSLPKFSIRDYVRSSRSKDINGNWPFSQGNLQLCLKHGVKDPLPPFQSLHEIKNNPFKPHDTKTTFLDRENVKIFVPKPSFDRTKIDISSCKHRDESDLASSQKTRESSKQAVKKCRLIVKSGNIILYEAMSSKICPVCKTFSSSSNTTLNAHIDQCLSVDSSSRSAVPDFKPTKHRLKPRRTRLMSDIYAAAPHCTIEELDRRNGRAMMSVLNSEDSKPCSKEKIKKMRDKNNDSGSVYIDSSGTKVRILSRLDVPPSALRVEENFDKSKFSISKKHQKYMKLSSPSKKCSKFEIHMPVEENSKEYERQERKKNRTKLFEAQNLTKLKVSEYEHLRPWACSKQTGFSKKLYSKDTHQFSPVEIDESCCSDSYSDMSCDEKSSNFSENPFFDRQRDKIMEHYSLTRKRSRSPVFRGNIQKQNVKKYVKGTMKVKFNTEFDEAYQEYGFTSNDDESEFNITATVNKISLVRNKGSSSVSMETTEIKSGVFGEKLDARDDGFIGNDFCLISSEQPVMNLSEYLDPECHKLTKPFDSHSSLDRGDRLFCTDEASNEFTLQKMDSTLEQIPIPGPPGSYLPPSPRDISPVDFHGNSSLTMSRVQNSDDVQDFVCGYLSSSTVSGPSAVSKIIDIPEMVSPIVALNFRDSQLMRRRTMSMAGDSNERPELFPMKVSSEGRLNFPGSVDFDSSGVPASSPILRLMGKNLMVVNQDQDYISSSKGFVPNYQSSSRCNGFMVSSSMPPPVYYYSTRMGKQCEVLLSD